MPPRWDMAPDVEKRLRKAVDDGVTLTDLAARFGKDYRTVRSALTRLGLKAAKDKREPSDGF